MPTYNEGFVSGVRFLTPFDDVFQAQVYAAGATVYGLAGNDTFRAAPGNISLFNSVQFVGNEGDDRFTVNEFDILQGASNFYGGSGYDTLEISARTPFTMANFQVGGYDAALGQQITKSVSFIGTTAVIQAIDVERFVIKGSQFTDYLGGGTGDDWLDGRGGRDYFYGSAGSDDYVFDTAGEQVSGEQAGGGIDSIFTTVSVSLRDNANVENLRLQSGNINGTGNELANLITGSTGSNRIAGGLGNDSLYGKGGADTFVFAEMGAAHRDSIWDFGADDRIELARNVFTGLQVTETGTLATGDFVVGNKATADHAQVIYNKLTGVLSYDADGNGAGAAQDIAFIGKNLGFMDDAHVLLA